MRKWTTAAGLLFLAAASVYPDGVLRAAGVNGEKSSGSDAKPAEPTDVFAPVDAAAPAAPAAPAAAPTTQPVAVPIVPVGSDAANAPQVNLKDIGTVEIHVNDANLVDVLRMLSLQSQKNIITSKDVRGSVTANLYDVTMKEALDAILHSNGFDYREKGNFIYVYTQKELAEMEKAQLVRKTEIFRLYYTPAANAANMIKPVLSDAAQVSFTTPAATGIDSDSKDVGGNSHAVEDVLVVTDFPERLDQVRAILKEVDRRPKQILVEAVILRATLQENNDLGIDFSAVGGVDFSTLNNVAAGAAVGGGFTQALTGQIIQNPNANAVIDDGFVAGQAGGSGLKLGVVKNNVGLFISALEGITDTVVMANPKVLVLNKQKGEVHVGSEQGYRTTVTSETLTAEDVKFLETGTRLIFRPYVGDNGYVRMEIKPEDSSGSVNAQGLPNKFVTQVTTNVMVKDGHTIVIGGLFRESNDRTRSQVPGLGSLPGVGAAFRRQTDSVVREEVIILLTPHIVKDDAAYSRFSEEQLKEAERLRVGMRKGMMPWGRERLAESCYEKAANEMKKENPDPQKALWHLNCATNLNPKFKEAIDMKARITGQEVTNSDNSNIRSFLRAQVMHDRENGKVFELDPPTTVPSLEEAQNRNREIKLPSTQPSAPVQSVLAAPVKPATQPAFAETPKELPLPTTKPAETVSVETEFEPIRSFDDK